MMLGGGPTFSTGRRCERRSALRMKEDMIHAVGMVMSIRRMVDIKITFGGMRPTRI